MLLNVDGKLYLLGSNTLIRGNTHDWEIVPAMRLATEGPGVWRQKGRRWLSGQSVQTLALWTERPNTLLAPSLVRMRVRRCILEAWRALLAADPGWLTEAALVVLREQESKMLQHIAGLQAGIERETGDLARVQEDIKAAESFIRLREQVLHPCGAHTPA